MEKYKSIIFLTLCSLFISLTANAQTIENSELLLNAYKSIKNIKSVVYKIDYKTKFLARRDTVYSTAICSLRIEPKDRLKTLHLLDVKITENGYLTFGQRMYDGKISVWTNYPIDSLSTEVKPLIEKNKRKIESIVTNYSYLLLNEYLIHKNPFKDLIPYSDKIGIVEKMLNDIPVYEISIAYQDNEEVKDHSVKHYIRKSDYLPIAFSSFLRFENMEQYNYYEVKYLEINPSLSTEQFNIEANRNINLKSRYTEFIKKTN